MSREWNGWQWCWGRTWGMAVPPAWGKKSQTHPHGQPVCLSSLVCLSAPHLQRGEVLFCLAGWTQQTWSPAAFAGPMAEPTTSQTPLHPQALAQWGPLRLCLQLLLTSDCTAILRHIAFPAPLEKNAFLCEMSRRSLPSDTPFHYYLLFLQQLPSKLRLHIQTENTSTIQRHTELPNSGSV